MPARRMLGGLLLAAALSFECSLVLLNKKSGQNPFLIMAINE
jgi:hypothetical protein